LIIAAGTQEDHLGSDAHDGLRRRNKVAPFELQERNLLVLGMVPTVPIITASEVARAVLTGQRA
jgi:hypothetical protein